MSILRRTFLFAFLAALSMPVCAVAGFDPAYASIAELRAALDTGRVTSEDLVRYYMKRIERFDQAGPHINAFITLNQKAFEQARQSDAATRANLHRGWLSGIPFVVKDNFDTADLPTSGGSAALRSSRPLVNAFVVQRLLDQGAILIGKTNMSELAASDGRLGYSSAGGLTVNPYDTARNVSGSSSGSAAAIAADFAAFALGTDTAGSVRAPASVAGLVGLRPTLGLVSRSGVIPLSLTFDTPGVMARNAQDVRRVLESIAGEDVRDAATTRRPASGDDAVQAPIADAAPSLRGLRLGALDNFRGGNPEVDAVEDNTIKVLEDRGAIIVPVTLPTEFEHLWAAVLGPVGEAEFKPQFERYLRTLPAGMPQTLTQLIAVSESRRVAESATPVNPARLAALRAANATELTDSPTYIAILTQTIPALRRQLQALMDASGLQGFVLATLSCPASARFDRPDPSYVCRSEDPYAASYVAAAVGFPEVTVPAGTITGNLPVGVSFMGQPFGESQLLDIAEGFQTALALHSKPPVLELPRRKETASKQ